ncbi:MAG: hypothetical protein WBB76_07205 [Gaiellaceae bacterium]
MTGTRRVRLLLLAAAAAAAASVLFLALQPGASHSAAFGSKIYAFAVPSNPGPVHACSFTDAPCPLNTWLQIPIYTANTYPLTTWRNQPDDANARWGVTNAFVVDSIDVKYTVNGVPQPDPFSSALTPPPSPSFVPWAGHWPSTVRCDSVNPSTCHVAGHPAVLPGENTAPLYFSWVHGSTEPDGTYVFTFTEHGTVNGTPLDVRASTPPILMTR